MEQHTALVSKSLTTPRAAAVAGIVFSILLLIALVIVRIFVPADFSTDEAWTTENWQRVELALTLVPFAGIAFLWFMGVIRDRLGTYEDRFFATVFLGSGLLFLAMLFASAAMAGGIIKVYGDAPTTLVQTGIYTYGRSVTYLILNVYAMKMAGVFMISTCTLFLRTGLMPRWMAYLGYALALFLLLSMNLFEWSAVVLPLWVLMISIYILIENYRRRPERVGTDSA